MRDIAVRIEELACEGFGKDEKLNDAERVEIIEFTASFEECSESASELSVLTDEQLVRKSYRAMVEYARGQI